MEDSFLNAALVSLVFLLFGSWFNNSYILVSQDVDQEVMKLKIGIETCGLMYIIATGPRQSPHSCMAISVAWASANSQCLSES